MVYLTEESPVIACWTGRFQPVHKGHIEILRFSLNTVELPHLCILTAYFGGHTSDRYGQFARANYGPEKNKLTVWERFRLMNLSLRGEGLEKIVCVTIAPRHDLDWSLASQFYPPKRIICLTNKDEFESAKLELWRRRGETVRVLDVKAELEPLTTTEIKRRINAGEPWERFISEAAHAYFREIDGPTRVFSGGDE